MATKLDLTKEYKTYYTAKISPEVVEFGEIPFLTIEGKGEPIFHRARIIGKNAKTNGRKKPC